ncbi:MAG: allantoate amidohydrolase [Saccharospirillum sp.]|nr:allantoate amidohydrolase [Saccharospirillum sp.]
MNLGENALYWCNALAEFTETPGQMQRSYLTDCHQQAINQLEHWLEDAQLPSWMDAAGNLWGRLPAREEDAPRVVIGSHIDTVPNGGIYDGILGIVLPLLVMKQFRQQGIALPFHLDLVAFGDEEGTRFGTTLLGSRALTGHWDSNWAGLTDASGVSLAEAFRQFELDIDRVKDASLRDHPPLAFLEVHIEQGPILEEEQLPVGIVTAINGARRFSIELTGMAGHAGTVPMHLRQDALAAAAEITLIVERVAREHGVTATVGRIQAEPGAVNVIAGKTRLSLDIRSERDGERDAALTMIWDTAKLACHERGIHMDWQETHSAPSVACADSLQRCLAGAIAELGITPKYLASGAGHDAMAMANLCPVGMMFVRCEGGISHHPDEAITAGDAHQAGLALKGWLLKLAAAVQSGEYRPTLV